MNLFFPLFVPFDLFGKVVSVRDVNIVQTNSTKWIRNEERKSNETTEKKHRLNARARILHKSFMWHKQNVQVNYCGYLVVPVAEHRLELIEKSVEPDV